MGKLIEIRDLVANFYTYEGVVKALNRVSLTIDRGSTFGLVGESGCGKSVTARSILRIVQSPGRIEGGQILAFLDEETDAGPVDLLRLSEKEMRRLRGDAISMIFQEPNAALNPTMSVGDQVAESFLFHQEREMAARVLDDLERGGYGPLNPILKALYRLAARDPEARLLRLLSRLPVLKWWRGPLKKEAIRRSIRTIADLGIPNPAGVVGLYPHNLSGGMKQRIVIAIALACSPVLLISDEATSNLDVTIQAQILELLEVLKKGRLSSILFITHDLGLVAETCDRVGVMYAGAVCETADVMPLFDNPLHPYTKALLAAAPKYEMEGEIAGIEGFVPNLVSPPPGCRFHPRCPKAMEVCPQLQPVVTEPEPNHFVACHLYP